MPAHLTASPPAAPMPARLDCADPATLLATLDHAQAEIFSYFREELPQAHVRQFFHAYKQGRWEQGEALRRSILDEARKLFLGPRHFPAPTQFAQSVWRIIADIPLGKVVTYGAIARALNPTRPPSAQAVGTAVGKNPFPVIVPCHRVVTSQGRLGHYAYGAGAKLHLLLHEGVEFYAPRAPRGQESDVKLEQLHIDNPVYMELLRAAHK